MIHFQTIINIVLLVFVVVMLFNIIIFVHELGHFLAGKWRGLKIDRFQIWFGKPIWKKEYKGVQYGLGWIPAGGFVALPQMAPMESIEGGDKDREPLPPITPLDKIIVASAGPLFSLLLALLAGVVVWGVGKPKDFVPSTVVGYVDETMPAYIAGIRPGDEILEINEIAVAGFAGSLDSITERIVLSSGDEIKFKVQRPGVQKPLYFTSKFKREDTRWFQRSGLRKVGIAPGDKSIVEAVYKGSPAENAGLSKGDQIITFNGSPLYSELQIYEHIEKSNYAEIALGVKKKNGELVDIKLTPAKPIQPKTAKPDLGIIWNYKESVDVRIVHPDPFSQVTDSLKMMWVTITSVADPGSSIGVDHLSGPVGIGQMLYSLLLTEDGWRRILGFMVLFNVNLAVLNMLPFPVLDGGHITMAILEKIFGKPIEMKTLEIIQTACALALISLMLYVTSKDIGDKFGRGGGGSAKEVRFAE
jgi:regulator of sigma E protease